MRSVTTPTGRPGADRLERLLRVDAGADTLVGEPPVEPAPEGPEGPDELVEPSDVDGVDDDRPVRGRHRHRGVPLLSVPESLRSSQLGVGVRAVRGLLVLVVVAGLVLGGRWLWTTQQEMETSSADRIQTGVSQSGQGGASPPDGSAGHAGPSVDLEPSEPPHGGGAAAQDGSGAGGGETAAPGAENGARAADLVVHVVGEVEEPGVVEVAPGSRVVDAIRAAGGLTADADQSTLNLARPLADGERVWVGRPGEAPPVAAGPVGQVGGNGPTGAGGVGGAGSGVPLDLNAATQADLEELPGIGPVTAGHILTWREEHGRFSSVDELLEVSGIGERTLAQLEPLVTVGG